MTPLRVLVHSIYLGRPTAAPRSPSLRPAETAGRPLRPRPRRSTGSQRLCSQVRCITAIVRQIPATVMGTRSARSARHPNWHGMALGSQANEHKELLLCNPRAAARPEQFQSSKQHASNTDLFSSTHRCLTLPLASAVKCRSPTVALASQNSFVCCKLLQCIW